MGKFDHIFIAPKDFDKSLFFYKDILAMKVASSWGEGTNERGAVLKNDAGMMVVIAEEHEHMGDNAWNTGINGHRPTMHLEVENVNQFFQELKKGEHVVTPPEDTHWGSRWCILKDPDDNLFAFNQG